MTYVEHIEKEKQREADRKAQEDRRRRNEVRTSTRTLLLSGHVSLHHHGPSLGDLPMTRRVCARGLQCYQMAALEGDLDGLVSCRRFALADCCRQIAQACEE